jgi:hypothetical protein
MSAKQFLIFLIYLVPFTAFFRDRAARPAAQFLDHGGAPGRALFDQYPGPEFDRYPALTLGFIVLVGGQHAILWLTGKLFNPAARPRLGAALDHRRHPVRAAAGDLRRDRDLHPAADRLQPAGRR